MSATRTASQKLVRSFPSLYSVCSFILTPVDPFILTTLIFFASPAPPLPLLLVHCTAKNRLSSTVQPFTSHPRARQHFWALQAHALMIVHLTMYGCQRWAALGDICLHHFVQTTLDDGQRVCGIDLKMMYDKKTNGVGLHIRQNFCQVRLYYCVACLEVSSCSSVNWFWSWPWFSFWSWFWFW